MYWIKILSQAVEVSKKSSWNAPPPLRIPYCSHSAPITFWNLPFLPSSLVVVAFSSFQHLSCLLSTAPPTIPMPPKRKGPWQLETVKLRLRAEQVAVARERAADLRYRQLEDDDRDPPKRTHCTERNIGKTSWAAGILCVLVLCCLLLAISVVFLSSVVLSFSRK